jgi:hypothetical protein
MQYPRGFGVVIFLKIVTTGLRVKVSEKNLGLQA